MPELPSGKHPDWSLSDERVFIEDLVNKRLEAFLVVFGAILGGALAADDHPYYQVLVLSLGSVLATALAFAIERAQDKLTVLL